MNPSTTADLDGERGRVTVRRWAVSDPTYVVALAHGLGEHTGRYDHVAAHLLTDGAEVEGPDHWAHGRSDGEMGLVDDLESIVTDFATVVDGLRERHPGVPVVVVGHSMGGLIATRYAQRYPDVPDALVLSGPVIGGNDDLLGLLDLPEIPDVPIDPDVLSRDPAVGAAYAADPLIYHGPIQRATLETLKRAAADVADGGNLGALPTLWIHGGADALVPLPETTRAFNIIGGSALEKIVYPGARHEIFNETNRDEVLSDLTQFLGRVGIPDATTA